MVRSRVPLVVTLVLVAVPRPGEAEEGRGGDDLVRWIAGACTRQLDPDAVARLDQVAGKAVTDWLRTGRFRESVDLAKAYLDCLERHSSPAVREVLQDKLRALRQVACFVPLVVFESEGKVDEALAADTLRRCPAPPAEAPADGEGAKRRWAEQVRRFMHLAAPVRAPEEVLDHASRYLAAFAAAGFPVAEAAHGAAPAGIGAGQDEDGPDPVFATRVFAVAASVASGRLDRLIEVSGGEETACKSLFLAALGLLQSMKVPKQAALPLTLHALMRRARMDALIAVSRDAEARFAGRECSVPAMVSALAISGLSGAQVDQAVADGRVADVARLAGAAPTVAMLPGKPESRIAVIEKLVEAGGSRRGERLCELGGTRLETGRASAAFEAYGQAMTALQGSERECAVIGRFRAALAQPAVASEVLASAGKDFVEMGPDAPAALGVIRGEKDPARRAVGVRALWAAAATAPAAGAREAIGEALVKVVDQEPGSAAAVAAVESLPADGGAKSAEEKVIWGLVAGRHHVEARDPAGARKAFRSAFDAARPNMEAAVGGTSALLRWLAARRHYEVLDETVRAARKAGVVKAGTLAGLAAIVGEVGERKRAMGLLKAAQSQKPEGEDEWLAIANAYARMDEPVLASAALGKVGAQKSWGPGPWMTKGRLEMARKRYRDAAAAYGKAAELAREECDPLFFRGLVRLLMGDPEGAEEDFLDCVDMGEDNAQVLGGLGYALFDQSRFDESATAFRNAIRKDEKAADNHLGLALALLRSGDAAGAVEAHRKAAVLEPAMGQGYAAAEKRGYVYSEVEKAAWDDLTRAVKSAAP